MHNFRGRTHAGEAWPGKPNQGQCPADPQPHIALARQKIERPLIERGLVDVIQPDTGRAGGITQMKKIAAMAEAHGIMMAPHSGSLGPVAEYAALHLLAAIPNALILERVEGDWPRRAEVITPMPQQKDGFLPVPDAPGLGV